VAGDEHSVTSREISVAEPWPWDFIRKRIKRLLHGSPAGSGAALFSIGNFRKPGRSSRVLASFLSMP